MREHQEAQRQHPKTEDRKKAQQAAQDQRHADCHPPDARTRHTDAEGAEHKPVACVIDAEAPCLHPALLAALAVPEIIPICHFPEMGIGHPNTSSFHFFEKTAWQIGQAFVLAHSHRAKQ
ncbi:hypothetical protein GGE46_001196 [Rhizobium etli]|uniref:Uncharacterized protein n=1 Tax=Rhizobium etli TaxID=29449 RepID=A0A7W6V8Q8_RHIET|nr:hypothetical protein [Rhizobium etli]MBB4534487.1 hypothetical protein [Rhizobium etli]